MTDREIQESFYGKRVLVTGGFGFIGSALTRRLLDLNANVQVVDAMIPETGANPINLADVSARFAFTQADVRDEATMRPLLLGQDCVFNLAGLSSHVGGMHDPVGDLEANALAQIRLLETCRIVNPSVRIIFASTRQVYGRVLGLPVGETTPVAPVDYNGVSKLAGEFYHFLAHRIYGLWTTNLRLTNTYGPRMRVKDARQTFIGSWLRLILDGERIPVFGRGDQIRDFNYVEDVVDAFLLCASNPVATGKTYNLGSSPISLLKLAELLISLNGGGAYSLIPYPSERAAIEIGDYAGDYSLIHEDLGWEPLVSLEDGLLRSLEYYRAHKAHYW
jgi:UDP-glucose 4-epimerase